MEREKDGLFGRLVQFWREKVRMQGEKNIGFWKEDAVENHFAELGAVAVLSQEETRGTFWQEEEERKTAEKKMMRILPETDEGKEQKEEKAAYSQRIFVAERFAEEKENEERRSGYVFAEDKPEKNAEKRKVIPVAAEKMPEKELVSEGLQEGDKTETYRKEEVTAESKQNVEYLMREITKRLWEEREGCGRKLR